MTVMSAAGRHLKKYSAEDVGFFEGPEKLLEVWYYLGSDDPSCAGLGLRKILRLADFWR